MLSGKVRNPLDDNISIHENLHMVRIHLKNHCQMELALVVMMVAILSVVK